MQQGNGNDERRTGMDIYADSAKGTGVEMKEFLPAPRFHRRFCYDTI